MNLTLKVKLCPDEAQFDSLLKTMERFNEACNFISDVAFEHHMANKVALQKLIYQEIRAKYGLSAQLTIRAIAKVVEVYKRDKSIQPIFKPHGAMVYDQRIMGWKGVDRVSILSLDGRLIVPYVGYDYFDNRTNRFRGQADLMLVDGVFYFCPIVDVPDGEPIKVGGVLGVDLGIVNLAVDSDGETFSGDKVEEVRSKSSKHRASLQSTGTRSAKRRLKRISGREARFRRDVNHCISKNIVAKAKGTERAIALEDLKGIRNQTTVRKAQRSRHSSWGFDQLRSFIEYKGKIAGVPVILVDPRGTSHICPKCAHNVRANRPNRNEFKCVQCGFAGSADHIASINIGARAVVNQPIVAEGFISEHCSQLQLQAHEL